MSVLNAIFTPCQERVSTLKNKFNLLTSKEWLPFQKSWFRYVDESKFLEDSIRFFTLSGKDRPGIYYRGSNNDVIKSICGRHSLTFKESPDYDFQYAIIDLRGEIEKVKTEADFEKIRKSLFELLNLLYPLIEERRFITIVSQNRTIEGAYHPFAWDLGYIGQNIFSLKDEKIGCIDEGHDYEKISPKNAGADCFYSMHFRKDELSPGVQSHLSSYSFSKVKKSTFKIRVPKWFILKPQRRNKDEILHPAKYPEDLTELFISRFTKLGDNVFDPMSGTGSSQIGAIKLERNGYGTELSPFFGAIAQKRCAEFINPNQESLFEENLNAMARIEIGDAREFMKFKFPQQNYLITSPPYWDMLNMKGAENQAKRINSGLKTNYSDSEDDFGNITDYKNFVDSLVTIYRELIKILEPGACLTIVVKNIKKKGSNYPFAWDLCRELQSDLVLLPEAFWLQDDISIAPFGYGNTWVSNTFHQYCLNFQVPISM